MNRAGGLEGMIRKHTRDKHTLSKGVKPSPSQVFLKELYGRVRVVRVDKGADLYHGTASTLDGPTPNGPAWFACNPLLAGQYGDVIHGDNESEVKYLYKFRVTADVLMLDLIPAHHDGAPQAIIDNENGPGGQREDATMDDLLEVDCDAFTDYLGFGLKEDVARQLHAFRADMPFDGLLASEQGVAGSPEFILVDPARVLVQVGMKQLQKVGGISVLGPMIGDDDAPWLDEDQLHPPLAVDWNLACKFPQACPVECKIRTAALERVMRTIVESNPAAMRCYLADLARHTID